MFGELHLGMQITESSTCLRQWKCNPRLRVTQRLPALPVLRTSPARLAHKEESSLTINHV